MLCLLTSCATLLNNKIQTIAIISDTNIKLKSVTQDSVTIQERFNHYITLRGKIPLYISYTNTLDSQLHSIEKNPFRSNTYWWNIMCNYGLGIVVDEFSDKKFAFPKKMYLTNDNKLVVEKKGNIKITIPLEYILYTTSLAGRQYTYLSMPGMNLPVGIEYYYKHNTYISSGISLGLYTGVSNNRTVDYGAGFSTYLRHGHILNNFEIAYGLSSFYNSRFSSVGLSIGATNMFTRVTGLQIFYEPNILNLNEGFGKYQPTFKMGLIFKINANP
jgi:hypothetical protein